MRGAAPLPQTPLAGGMLWFAAIILAAANFVAVLDMTIANVSVPTIAGGLGATTSQGTWVITAYAVAEAITVPLTGWLAARFGAVRVFATAMAAFGLTSALCGLAGSLGMLVLTRICQGVAGGPLMPLSQTLLLRIFPQDKAAAAVGLWAITTLVAPVLGPILGGWLCDNYTWPWIFWINLPIALLCAAVAWRVLQRYEEAPVRNPIDRMGLALLVIWVGALQLLIDEGKDLDWFASPEIRALAIVAILGFLTFLIWELHEAHPIVDLRIFRHRGFTIGVATLSFAMGAMFGANVLTPQWLQGFMGYTSTQSGEAMAWMGFFAVLVTPLAASLAMKRDARKIVFGGVLWLGVVTLARSIANTDMTYWQVSAPLMLMGLGLPFFFVPLTGFALACVEERETASAAGLMSFLRTLSGAIATSTVMTAWEDGIRGDHAELVAVADGVDGIGTLLGAAGFDRAAALQAMDSLLTTQSVMLATNRIMAVLGLVFVFAAAIILLAPKPARVVDPTRAGH